MYLVQKLKSGKRKMSKEFPKVVITPFISKPCENIQDIIDLHYGELLDTQLLHQIKHEVDCIYGGDTPVNLLKDIFIK